MRKGCLKSVVIHFFLVGVIVWFCTVVSYAQTLDRGCTGANDWSPFALAIVPALEIPSGQWNVYGLRLNLFVGRHENIGYFDIGGLANLGAGEVYGIQTAGIYNQVGTGAGIFQTAGIANHCLDDLLGLQIAGVFSKTDDRLTGGQIAPLAFAGTLQGLQIGIFNRVEILSGLQIGVVNSAYQAEGVQIGLLNVIADSSASILPILNIGF